jgi:hypothetical protein
MSRSHLNRAIAAGLLLMFGASVAQAGTSPDDWSFTITPYVWVPGIDGNLKVPPQASLPNPVFPITKTNVLDALNFAAMVSFEARKGDWSIYSDLDYVDLGFDKTAPTELVLKGKEEFTGSIFELAGSYTMWRDASASHIDILAGGRYLNLSNDVTLDLGDHQFKFSDDKDFTDAIIGVKGEARLGEGGHWFIPFYADIGGGSSNHNWLAYAGLGYAFHWGDLFLNYRYLEYQPGKNSSIDTIKLYGPVFGASFHF